MNRKSQNLIKIIADKVVSAISLIILSPVLWVVAIAIYFLMGCPVLFTKYCPSKDAPVFKLYWIFAYP